MNWQHLFFSLHGRITRLQFWAGIGGVVFFQLLVQSIAIGNGAVDYVEGVPPLWLRNLSLALDVICAWPLFAVLAKRQEDREQSAFLSWCLVTLILIFSICESFGLTQQANGLTLIGYITGLPLLTGIGIALFELGCRRGTAGPNRFGPDPLS